MDVSCGARPRTVYGTGHQTRDDVYVDDVIGGLISLVEHPQAHGEYNIEAGRGSSVLDVIAALESHADGDFEPVFAE